ncbi:GspH/FimT family pseudopilin [Variovorax sp. J22P168]|uniref:GspH/FimT family pseudopilin n=1 Tax=Variovorax jilinensis TaxID=3053513 RepID=UPI002574E4B9|nr:GspH/FimT family pseudopilin [Variovorax sp. J22P168]MDM0014131.1 GspH/FimT family pseudopilin [Variovorax sp. J22P168]
MRNFLDHQEGAGVLTQPRSSRRRRVRGFTIVELMVTIALLSLLMAVAAPSLFAWVRNAKIRTVAEGLQNGLRVAQNESLRRSRQVVFSLTDSKLGPTATAADAKADGNHWVIFALPSMGADDSSDGFVEAGVLTDVASGVKISGPGAICFNSVGRLIANEAQTLTDVTGGETCAIDTPRTYNISLDSDADRKMRVIVSPGGQVRMCDPNKDITKFSDGCPP